MVADLVTPFVSANSLFSAEQTDQAKQEAVNKTGPVSKRYVSGEIIVRRGQVITPLTWEALQQYGLIQTENNSHELLAALALVVLLSGFTILYFERRKLQPVENLRGPALIAVSFLGFLIAARFLIPNRTVIPYIFPLPAFALVIGSLFNLEIGLVLSIVLSILTAFGLPNSLDLTIYYILTSFVGVLVLGKGLRVSAFIWAGIAIGAAGSAALIAYRLASSYTDLIGMATLVGASFFNGLASASLNSHPSIFLLANFGGGHRLTVVGDIPARPPASTINPAECPGKLPTQPAGGGHGRTSRRENWRRSFACAGGWFISRRREIAQPCFLYREPTREQPQPAR